MHEQNSGVLEYTILSFFPSRSFLFFGIFINFFFVLKFHNTVEMDYSLWS